MYLDQEELKSAIYDYQVEQITQGDNSIVLAAIEAAIEEVKSYLTPGDQQPYKDGRRLYDVEAIFAAEGEERHPLILAHVKTCAQWWIIQLSNVDIIFEQVKDRYDRAIKYLTKIHDGELNISTLPVLEPSEDDEENLANKAPYRSGSRQKFNHD
jgi:phage gp36-like protein